MIQKRTIVLICITLLTLGNIVPTLAQDEDCSLTADEHRTEGLAQYQDSDFAGAIASYSCVIELAPEDAVAYNNLGFFYGLEGDADSALANFATAEELDPTYPLTFINRGDIYLKQSRFEDAIADFETAFELDPEALSAFTYNQWGTSHYFMGNYEESIPQFTRAIEINPDYVDALNNRGFSYIETGEFVKALSDFRRANHLDPDFVIPYVGIGDSQYALGRARPSLDAYTTYVELIEQPVERAVTRIEELEGYLVQPEAECTDDDSELDTYLGAGNQALQSGNLEIAINFYSCAIQNFPDEAMGYNNRGFAHLQSGELNFALSDLTDAIAHDPELALAYSNRGQTYYSFGDYEGALNDLQRSIELDRSATNQAYATSGYVYADIGQYERAIPYLVTAATSFTGNPDALSNLAYAYYQLGQYEESFLAFEQLAVAVNRDNFPERIEELVVEVEELTGKTVTSAKTACGIVTTGGTSGMARDFKVDGNQLMGEGKFDEAIEKFDCAIEMSPFDSYAYNNRGLAYFQKGEIEPALENFNKSLELNPWDAQAHSNRGYVFTEIGEYEVALVDFNIALSNDPEYINGWYGRADLYVKLEDYEAAKADLDQLIVLLDGDIPAPVIELIDIIESNLE